MNKELLIQYVAERIGNSYHREEYVKNPAILKRLAVTAVENCHVFTGGSADDLIHKIGETHYWIKDTDKHHRYAADKINQELSPVVAREKLFRLAGYFPSFEINPAKPSENQSEHIAA